jgi:hypothetical protein
MTDHDVHMTNAVGMCDDHKHTHVCSGEHLPTNTSRAERTPLGSCSGKKRMAWQPQPQADTRRKRKRQLIITLLRGTAKKPRAGPGRPRRQYNMIVSLKGNNRCPQPAVQRSAKIHTIWWDPPRSSHPWVLLGVRATPTPTCTCAEPKSGTTEEKRPDLGQVPPRRKRRGTCAQCCEVHRHRCAQRGGGQLMCTSVDARSGSEDSAAL